MTPLDIKNYRAHRNTFSVSGWSVIGIVALVMLLGFMGERDREAQVKRVQEAAAVKCNG